MHVGLHHLIGLREEKLNVLKKREKQENTRKSAISSCNIYLRDTAAISPTTDLVGELLVYSRESLELVVNLLHILHKRNNDATTRMSIRSESESDSPPSHPNTEGEQSRAGGRTWHCWSIGRRSPPA